MFRDQRPPNSHAGKAYRAVAPAPAYAAGRRLLSSSPSVITGAAEAGSMWWNACLDAAARCSARRQRHGDERHAHPGLWAWTTSNPGGRLTFAYRTENGLSSLLRVSRQRPDRWQRASPSAWSSTSNARMDAGRDRRGSVAAPIPPIGRENRRSASRTREGRHGGDDVRGGSRRSLSRRSRRDHDTDEHPAQPTPCRRDEDATPKMVAGSRPRPHP